MALNLSATAKKLIRQLAGKSEDLLFYIVRESGSSIDANTGQYTTGTTTKTAIDGALVGYSRSVIDGTMILTGDGKLIAPGDVDYQAGDYFEIYGVNYTVIDPKPINHAGVNQLWIFQVRKQ